MNIFSNYRLFITYIDALPQHVYIIKHDFYIHCCTYFSNKYVRGIHFYSNIMTDIKFNLCKIAYSKEIQ